MPLGLYTKDSLVPSHLLDLAHCIQNLQPLNTAVKDALSPLLVHIGWTTTWHRCHNMHLPKKNQQSECVCFAIEDFDFVVVLALRASQTCPGPSAVPEGWSYSMAWMPLHAPVQKM